VSGPHPKGAQQFPRLRQSLLASYDDCALQARFDTLWRRGYSSHPQGRGTLFHAFAAKCLQEMALHGEGRIEIDVAQAIMREVMRQADVDDVCHQPHCDLPARVIPEKERDEDGKELICGEGHKHYSAVVNVPASERSMLEWLAVKFAKDNTWDVSHLVDVERRLETTITYPDPEGGFVERVLTGQLDALFVDPLDPSHAIVLDYKSTWRLPAETEVSFEGYFQQRFYALLVMRNYRSINRVTLREFYVNYSTPREATLDRDKLEAIEADVSALVERFDRSVDKEIWRPTPGRHCSYCPRPQACPIPVHVRGEGRIVAEEDAQRLGGQLVVAEVVVKQTRKALQAYVEHHGPVPVKDSKGMTVWGYEQTVTKLKPDQEQVQAALALGEDPAKLFRERRGTRFGQITLKPGQERSEDDALAAALKASLEEKG
jgi:hypothetical protein